MCQVLIQVAHVRHHKILYESTVKLFIILFNLKDLVT